MNSSNACGGGSIDVEVSVHGQTWSLDASASPFRGSAQHKAGTEFTLMINTPDYDIWLSTAGTATYTGDKFVTVDVTMTDLMVPEGPGTSAHLVGSFSCA